MNNKLHVFIITVGNGKMAYIQNFCNGKALLHLIFSWDTSHASQIKYKV